jgi:hypothetical protein
VGRRLIAVAAVVAALVLVLPACGRAQNAESSLPGLPPRKISVGSVEMTITPRRIDSTGARFDISLDKHADALDVDLAASAMLTVGDRTWGDPHWSGQQAGSDHRTGTLRFVANGDPAGSVRLLLGAPPTVAIIEWPR